MQKKIKGFFYIGFIISMLAACSNNNVSSEIKELHEEVNEDNTRQLVVELVEAIVEERDYTNELDHTLTELNKTIRGLEEMEFSSTEAMELRDLYLSSLSDYQVMAEILLSEGVTDDNINQVELLAESANAKQLNYISEIIRLGDIEIPANLDEAIN